jgi:predicted CXXCH cytochrome family protein
MWAVRRTRRYGVWLLPLGLCFLGATVVACDDDEPTAPQPPGTFTITAETNVDSIELAWTAMANVDSFRAEIATNPTLTKWVAGDATEAMFTSDDGVEDGADYTATVYAVNETGETASQNSPVVTPDFFPWDENFVTSLHSSRMGKATFYNETPNNGFEVLTGVALTSLPCQNCHWEGQPGAPNGCQGCHDTADPQLGAEVDDSMEGVCVKCHGRLATEVSMGYTDVHRDQLNMTCMDCHSKEDVMGDGNTYVSMFDDGAIDAKCENCHTTLATNSYHAIHEESVDCSTCHMQTVISCYNCHLEGQLDSPPIKKARGKIHNWKFLLNRNGKVYPATFQTVEYQGDTWLAWGAYYSHTIDKNAVSGCSDCHGNANVLDLAADSVLEVVKWDSVNPPAGDAGYTALTGVIPIPFNYQSALKFDFFHWDGTNWSFVEAGPDGWQMIADYFQPLTDAQLTALN